MKWANHKLIAASVAYAATGNFIAILPAVVGSILPDAIEVGFGSTPGTQTYREWCRNHRGRSHWVAPYAVIAIIAKLFGTLYGCVSIDIRYSLSVVQAPTCMVLFFIQHSAIGAVTHVAADTLSGNIPAPWNPRKRLGRKIIRMGTPLEYLFAFCLAGVLFFAGWRIHG